MGEMRDTPPVFEMTGSPIAKSMSGAEASESALLNTQDMS